MITLLAFCALVYLNEDTLFFVENDSIFDRWILTEEVLKRDESDERVLHKAKVAKDSLHFLVYSAVTNLDYIPRQTEIVFYDAQQKVLWSERREDTVHIVYELSDILDSMFIVVDAALYGTNPSLYVIEDSVLKTVIKRDEWWRITDYEVSPSNRYLVLHTRRLFSRKPYDFIYSVDLKTDKRWEYAFPICVSCKNARIWLAVDDTGRVEVVYKAEHRIFSNEGKLVDLFLKLD